MHHSRSKRVDEGATIVAPDSTVLSVEVELCVVLRLVEGRVRLKRPKVMGSVMQEVRLVAQPLIDVMLSLSMKIVPNPVTGRLSSLSGITTSVGPV